MKRWRVLVSAIAMLGAHTAVASACSDPGVHDPTNPDGSVVIQNPGTSLTELGAPTPGQAIFDRRGGRLQFGLNESAVHNGQASAPAVGSIIAAMGGTIVRQGLDWKAVQPEAGCPYHWGPTDGQDHFWLAHGVRPLWVIYDAPGWATGGSDTCTNCTPTSAHIQDFANLAAAVATRYNLSAGVEIWNEPNLEKYWHLPNVAAYAQLLVASWNAVHAAKPNMRVLAGSLSDSGNDTSFGISIPTFVKQMVSDNVLGDMSALSIHPYPLQPPDANGDDGFTKTFEGLADPTVLGPNASQRLVVTEVGAAVSGSGHPYNWSLQGQCTTLVNEYNQIDQPGSSTLPLMANTDAVVFDVDVEGGDGYGFGTIASVWNSPLGQLLGNPPDAYTYTPRPVYSEFKRTLGAPTPSSPGAGTCAATTGTPVTYSATQ